VRPARIISDTTCFKIRLFSKQGYFAQIWLQGPQSDLAYCLDEVHQLESGPTTYGHPRPVEFSGGVFASGHSSKPAPVRSNKHDSSSAAPFGHRHGKHYHCCCTGSVFEALENGENGFKNYTLTHDSSFAIQIRWVDVIEAEGLMSYSEGSTLQYHCPWTFSPCSNRAYC
jgi:hypothetical protein